MSTHWKYIWWCDKSIYHWFALKMRVSLPPPLKEAEEWNDLAIFQVGRNRKKTRPCGYIIFQIPGQIEIYFRIHSDWELMTGLTNVKNQLLNILAGFLLIKISLTKNSLILRKLLLIASTQSSVEPSGEVNKNCCILRSIKFWLGKNPTFMAWNAIFRPLHLLAWHYNWNTTSPLI